MELFPREIQDGITSLGNKATYASAILLDSPHETKIDWDISNLELAKAEEGQVDLYYLKAVLASVGWNGNDDIFTRPNTWAAKETPKDKQFNLLHEDKIIGHITSNYVVDNYLQIITSSEEPNEDFSIVVNAVIYKYWKDPAFTDSIAKIIEEIENDEWFVSMECLLANFDYGFKFPDGAERIIARDESTSYFTKYLKQYGGSGKYGEAKIGRVLRDFVFSGVGLVKTPANKKSVILASIIPFQCKDIPDMPIVIGTEVSMADNQTELETQIEAMREENTKLQAKLADVDSLTQAVAEKEAALQTKDSEIGSLSEKLTAAESAVNTANERIVALETQIAAMMEDMKKKEKMSKAKASGVFSDEELNKIEASLDKLSDDNLDFMIEIAKTRVENKKKSDSESCAASELSETETKEVVAEQHEDSLETAEPEKEISLATETDETKELEKVRANLSEFVNTNYFNSKSKKNKGGK